MEGSESGALVPSDTSLEVETWVKLCNFPAEFLTADALSMIGSSFGSLVMMDEDTDEKVENHKWPPKLRRKLHSRKTFVRILVLSVAVYNHYKRINHSLVKKEFDCGMFMIKYADFYSRDIGLRFSQFENRRYSQEEIDEVRIEWANCALEHI